MSVDYLYESKHGPVEIGPMEPDRDRESILELFSLVFGREKSREVWDWQFVDHPDGLFYEVGRTAEGKVVSQYAALPTRVQIDGADYCYGQIVDSMVHPDFRAGLRHFGLFSATTAALVDRCGNRDGVLVMMGLPNPPAFRIGRRLNQGHAMGKVYFHTKAIDPDPGVPSIPEVIEKKKERFRIVPVTRFSADLDELWARVRGRFAVISHRDAVHMNWRYADSPDPAANYHILEVRDADSDQLLGFAVGVIGYLDHPDGVIADWFVDPDRPLAAEALLDVIEETMSKVSMTRVQCFLNFAAEESRFFEDRGYDLAPTHYRMMSRCFDPEIVTSTRLARDWYFTLGDFDVV